MNYLEMARQYRKQADECRRLAALAQPPNVRVIYLRLAVSYEHLASDMESYRLILVTEEVRRLRLELAI